MSNDGQQSPPNEKRKVSANDDHEQSKGRPSENQPSQAVPPSVTENEQIYLMLMDSLAHRVSQRLDQNLATRRTAYIAAIGISLTVLLALGGYIGNLVLEIQVEKQISERFEAALEKQISAIEFLPRLSALRIDLALIDQAVQVSAQQVDQALQEFKDLYITYANAQDDVDAKTRRQAQSNERLLAPSFDLLVKNLAAIDDAEAMARLVGIAPALAENSDTVTQTLTQYFGRNLIGAAGGADTWQPNGTNRAIYENYRTYADRARDTGFPEQFLAFEPTVWIMEKREDDDILELVADIDTLNEADLRAYKGLLGALVTEQFTRSPNASSGRIKKRSREFVERFRDRSVVLESVATEAGF